MAKGINKGKLFCIRESRRKPPAFPNRDNAQYIVEGC